MITGIALNVILALNLVSDEDVFVGGNLSPDWNGTPQILITTEPTKPEDVTQGSVISSETLLSINVVAETDQAAWDTAKAAARAVYKKFEELEPQPSTSGILCITLVEYDTFQVPNQSYFQAFVKFRVMHSFTL